MYYSYGSICHYMYLPAVSSHVPPLDVYLVNDSPTVSNGSVQAEFQITRPVAGVSCILRSQYSTIRQLCEKNTNVYTLYKHSIAYILYVVWRVMAAEALYGSTLFALNRLFWACGLLWSPVRTVCAEDLCLQQGSRCSHNQERVCDCH